MSEVLIPILTPFMYSASIHHYSIYPLPSLGTQNLMEELPVSMMPDWRERGRVLLTFLGLQTSPLPLCQLLGPLEDKEVEETT